MAIDDVTIHNGKCKVHGKYLHNQGWTFVFSFSLVESFIKVRKSDQSIIKGWNTLQCIVCMYHILYIFDHKITRWNVLGECDFQKDFCTWYNIPNTMDDFDWISGSGGTPSSYTGPSSDRNGNATGFVYILYYKTM